MSKIILIRHGESTFNRARRFQGQSDAAELTELGHRQAQAAGRWLADTEVARVVASPLTRAAQTADLVADGLGYPRAAIEPDPRLMEVDLGHWAGRERDEIERAEPALYRTWVERPYDLCLAGRFPVRELHRRLESFCDELHQHEGTLVIVAHRGPIAALIVKLMRRPPREHGRRPSDPGSVTMLQEDGPPSNRVYRLLCVNVRPRLSDTSGPPEPPGSRPRSAPQGG